ncbi:hypothetical protein A4G31_19305 [Mycobacterium persicum]|nr:hypothetical protein A4G31_19305 [Mycobacterium persicum]
MFPGLPNTIPPLPALPPAPPASPAVVLLPPLHPGQRTISGWLPGVRGFDGFPLVGRDQSAFNV